MSQSHGDTSSSAPLCCGTAPIRTPQIFHPMQQTPASPSRGGHGGTPRETRTALSPINQTPQKLTAEAATAAALTPEGMVPLLECPTLDDTDDFCFCRFTVIITCSWTRCFPVPFVFSL